MFDSSLLMQGDSLHVAQAFATATLGTVSLAAAMERWFMRPLSLPLTGVFLVAALTLIIPGWQTDCIGLALFGAGALVCHATKNKTTFLVV